MKQGVVFGFLIIVISLVSLVFIHNQLSGEYGELTVQMQKDGKTIYEQRLNPELKSVVWYVQEDDGDQMVLEDEDIIDYYDFDMDDTAALLDTDNINYNKISKVSGANAEINMVSIEDGEVSVYEANCPDRKCVKTGSISQANQSIVCVPHQFVVEIVGEGDFDA